MGQVSYSLSSSRFSHAREPKKEYGCYKKRYIKLRFDVMEKTILTFLPNRKSLYQLIKHYDKTSTYYVHACEMSIPHHLIPSKKKK